MSITYPQRDVQYPLQLNTLWLKNLDLIDPELRDRFDSNTTGAILDGLDDLHATGDSYFGNNKETFRTMLLERAQADGSIISPRERELINKAVDGTLTPGERTELTNLLPEMSRERFTDVEKLRKKPDSELLEEVRDIEVCDEDGNGTFDQTSDSMESKDYRALEELKRRASEDGRMSPELNALFSKMFDQGKTLTDREFERFRDLLSQEDGIGV